MLEHAGRIALSSRRKRSSILCVASNTLQHQFRLGGNADNASGDLYGRSRHHVFGLVPGCFDMS